MEIKMYDFQKHGDKRGMLVALEEMKDIPFEQPYPYQRMDNLQLQPKGCFFH